MELASLNQLTVGEVEDKISAEKSALARTQKKRLDFFIPPPPGGSRQTIFFLFVQITPLGTVVPWSGPFVCWMHSELRLMYQKAGVCL